MTTAKFEIGISPPDATFKAVAFPAGGTWPETMIEVLESSLGREIEPSERVTYELPRQQAESQSLLEKLRQKMEPVLDYRLTHNPSLADIHSSPWYSGMVDVQSDGFAACGIFQDQLRCELPKPYPITGHDAGCGIRKQQVRKLQIAEPKRIKSADAFQPYVDPFVLHWQMLVVSSRFRTLLEQGGFQGFRFLPISGPDAVAEDRSLAIGQCESDSTDWFQWVITGRTKPIPIRDFHVSRGQCSLCKRVVGSAQPHYLSQPVPLDCFSEGPDIQVCDELELPSGGRIMSTEGDLFLSSRLVELCVREKIRGLSGLSGNSKCFEALYLDTSART